MNIFNEEQENLSMASKFIVYKDLDLMDKMKILRL